MSNGVCLDCGVGTSGHGPRCRKCAGLHRRAPREKCNGYLRDYAPEHPLAAADGYVISHRKVLHDAGVHVPDDCHVHHINGDKRDNRLANLKIMSPQEHSRHHAAETTWFVNQHGKFKRVSEQSPEEREAKRQRKLAYLREWTRRCRA